MPCTRRINLRLQASGNGSTILKPGNVNMSNKVCGSSGHPSDKEAMTTFSGMIVQPKHAHFPDIPLDSCLFYEAVLFVYGILVMILQYVHLYKTVWWLPQSHATYGLNFYMIDPHLFSLLCIIMIKRLIWTFIKEAYKESSPRSCTFWFIQLIKLILTIGMTASFFYTAYHVILSYPIMYLLLLCYPIAMYVTLFWPSLRSLMNSSRSDFDERPIRSKREQKPAIPSHNCTMSPESVRDEVEHLKTDFNGRIKQVLFVSMLCAYYMCFIPVCFAQNTLYYDPWWVSQHAVIVWVSAFVLCLLYYLPPKYVDTLHRCALHLGRWQKVEGRHAHVPYNAWSELQVWPMGALVKHVRGLFKAEGINNTAEPGNNMHARFFFMFHKPLRVVNWLLIITWSLIMYQFFTLIQSSEWSHILSTTFMLFCNYYILFRLMRDRFILNRTYREEQIMQHMHQT
ncbi:transmembrane protein 39A-like isoform X2 [Lineus longissimus]|uniref:transmembrane protein 39A-like isoform X2 n=1 Tax=Lineus longissimus TaxID=88925 RepID=UPI002B4D826C